MESAMLVTAQLAAACASGTVSSTDIATTLQQYFEATVVGVSLAADIETYVLLTNVATVGDLNVDFICCDPQQAAVPRLTGSRKGAILDCRSTVDEDLQILARRCSVQQVIAAPIIGEDGRCPYGLLYIGQQTLTGTVERMQGKLAEAARLLGQCLALRPHSMVLDKLRSEGLLGPAACPVCKGDHQAAGGSEQSEPSRTISEAPSLPFGPQIPCASQRSGSVTLPGMSDKHGEKVVRPHVQISGQAPATSIQETAVESGQSGSVRGGPALIPGNAAEQAGSQVPASGPPLWGTGGYNHQAILEYIKKQPKETTRRRSRKNSNANNIPDAVPVYQDSSVPTPAPKRTLYKSASGGAVQRRNSRSKDLPPQDTGPVLPSPFAQMMANSAMLPYDPTPQHQATEFSRTEGSFSKRRAVSAGPLGMEAMRSQSSWGLDMPATELNNAYQRLHTSSSGKRRFGEDPTYSNCSSGVQPVSNHLSNVRQQRYRPHRTHSQDTAPLLPGTYGTSTADSVQRSIQSAPAAPVMYRSTTAPASQTHSYSHSAAPWNLGMLAPQRSSDTFHTSASDLAAAHSLGRPTPMQQQQQLANGTAVPPGAMQGLVPIGSWTETKGGTTGGSMSPVSGAPSQLPSPPRQQLSWGQDQPMGTIQAARELPSLHNSSLASNLHVTAQVPMSGAVLPSEQGGFSSATAPAHVVPPPGSLTAADKVPLFHTSSMCSQQDTYQISAGMHMDHAAPTGPPLLRAPSFPEWACSPVAVEPDASQLERLTLNYDDQANKLPHTPADYGQVPLPLGASPLTAAMDLLAGDQGLTDLDLTADSLMGSFMADLTESDALNYLTEDGVLPLGTEGPLRSPETSADIGLLWKDSGPASLGDALDILQTPKLASPGTFAAVLSSPSQRLTPQQSQEQQGSGKKGLFSSITARMRGLKSKAG